MRTSSLGRVCEHLRAWEESAERARLVSEANRYTQGKPHYDVLTGLDTWFTLPAQLAARPPQRARMTLVSWIGIFPLVYLYSELFRRILPPGTPAIVTIFAVTALVVPTMTYIVAPRHDEAALDARQGNGLAQFAAAGRVQRPGRSDTAEKSSNIKSGIRAA